MCLGWKGKCWLGYVLYLNTKIPVHTAKYTTSDLKACNNYLRSAKATWYGLN